MTAELGLGLGLEDVHPATTNDAPIKAEKTIRTGFGTSPWWGQIARDAIANTPHGHACGLFGRFPCRRAVAYPPKEKLHVKVCVEVWPPTS